MLHTLRLRRPYFEATKAAENDAAHERMARAPDGLRVAARHDFNNKLAGLRAQGKGEIVVRRVCMLE